MAGLLGGLILIGMGLGRLGQLDATGLVALESALAQLYRSGCMVILCGLQPQPAGLLRRAKIVEVPDKLAIQPDLAAAVVMAREIMEPVAPRQHDSAL